ncbi:ABC-type multidrug transport system permease subunit [Rhizobium sp. BK529]|uniref:hypothetical protein n=1 Tax=unclassified Rhizobium TaxID=2613769 RepID=UPI001053A3A6|nr:MULTISPECIES: hypothetical protein [unclassified Rhizobium]MBB3593487.1 ABC-type multidrug transport system permease subunit [Rhizobium sp. BK529]TCS03278.1 hypothetical protein EV281_104361 [Rhizobium sp. BK418]
MPLRLQYAMVISPTPHFVSFSEAKFYHGAGWDAVWQQTVVLGMIGMLFFMIALVPVPPRAD